MAPSKSPRVRLFHIRDEIEGVAGALQGIAFAEYEKSYMLRRAVERALQIISEAARSLPSDLLTEHPAAPWRAIIGIGNVLRHEYQHLDDAQLWKIATVDLPELHAIILRMLVEFER